MSYLINMGYFDDLKFISGSVVPECEARIDRSFPDYHTVEFLLSGRMYFAVDKKPMVVIDRPAVFWHTSGHRYKYGNCEGRTWFHHWVAFKGKRADRIMKEGFCRLSPDGYIYVSTPKLYAGTFTGLVKFSHDNNKKTNPEGILLLENLLFMLMNENSRINEYNPFADAIGGLEQKISEHPFKEYDFEREAAGMKLSYSHFRRLFREITAYSPHDHLLLGRMKKAGEEIRNSTRPIKEIAFEAGYSDYAQFSKMFKKKVGISPDGYRQAMQFRNRGGNA